MLIKQNTWPALEVLKALAIISMIIIHSWGWIITDDELLSSQNPKPTSPFIVLAWCGIWGYFILEIGKKKLTINLNKKPTP